MGIFYAKQMLLSRSKPSYVIKLSLCVLIFADCGSSRVNEIVSYTVVTFFLFLFVFVSRAHTQPTLGARQPQLIHRKTWFYPRNALCMGFALEASMDGKAFIKIPWLHGGVT